MQKSKNIEKWAHVLLNIKYKFFKIEIKEGNKINLLMFFQQRELTLYFDDVKRAKMVFALINENKKNILLKDLTNFSDKLKMLKKFLNFK